MDEWTLPPSREEFVVGQLPADSQDLVTRLTSVELKRLIDEARKAIGKCRYTDVSKVLREGYGISYWLVAKSPDPLVEVSPDVCVDVPIAAPPPSLAG